MSLVQITFLPFQSKIKTREPRTTSETLYKSPHKINISTTLPPLPRKMKFEFHTVAAFALLVGPVLGKASGGLRKNTKVRVDFRISPMIAFLCTLAHRLFFLLLVHFLVQTGRTQPCCSGASQTR
jgi:hypothetical protein